MTKARFIPEDVYAVCTYQLGSTPKQFIASRSVVSVASDKKILLTVEDKNLNEEFTCKSPTSLASSVLAFGAGLIIGAVLVLSGVGLIIVAVAGVMVLGVGSALTIQAIMHKCTDPMKAGEWMLPSPVAKFNGEYAITEMSMLQCSEGGILTSFFDKAIAEEAASSIAFGNRIELGINVTLAGALGVSLPIGFAGVKGMALLKAATIFGGTNVFGLLFTWTVIHSEKEYMRKDEEMRGNEFYKNLNDIEGNDRLGTVSTPADPNDAQALLDLDELVELKNKYKENKALVNDIAELEKYANENNLGKRYKFKKNPKVIEFFDKVHKGDYGEGLKEAVNSNEKHNLAYDRDNIRKLKNAAEARKPNVLKQGSKPAGLALLFVLPFVSTYFTEKARRSLAKYAQQDLEKANYIANPVLTKSPM